MSKRLRKKSSAPAESVAPEPPFDPRMTADEKAAVLRLWEAEERERNLRLNEPTAQDMSEGLDISAEHAQALVKQARIESDAREKRHRFRIAVARVAAIAALLGLIYACIAMRSVAAETAKKHRIRAEVMEDGSRFAAAEDEWREAIHAEPGNLLLRRALADCYFTAENWPKAETSYRELLKTYPNVALYHERLADTLFNQHREAEAAPEFRKTTEIEPRNAEAWHALGDCYWNLDQFAAAEPPYREAMRLEPTSAIYIGAVANAVYRQNRLAEAETLYRKAQAITPKDDRLHDNLGLTLVKLGRYAEAEAEFEAAIQINNRDAGFYCNLAGALLRQGKRAAAIEAAKTGLRRGAKDQPIIHELGLSTRTDQ